MNFLFSSTWCISPTALALYSHDRQLLQVKVEKNSECEASHECFEAVFTTAAAIPSTTDLQSPSLHCLE